MALALLPGCTPWDGFAATTWFAARQMDYLVFATETPLDPRSLLGVLNHLERERRDPTYRVPPGSIPDGAWDPIFDKLYRLRDTSDFDLLYLLNLLYAFRGHPAASEALWQKAEEAVVSFKYWYTDPTPLRAVDGEPVVDGMWYWTENHVLLFRVNEYLAGQLLPDRRFEVTGLTGREHMERARPEILRWIEERARFGFTEWHSNVYYQKDMTPLLSLVEWADDPELARRAEMLLDVVLLDVALHLHRGTFGATHGRSTIKDKASADTEDSFHSARMLFEDTRLPWRSRSAADASLFARARRYRLPEVIRRIARDDAVLEDRERMNLPLDEVPPPDPAAPVPPAPFGLDYEDEAHLPFWWSMGAQPVWMMLRLTLTVAERENLWASQFAPFQALRDFVWVEGDFEATVARARGVASLLWPVIDQSVLKEVHTYTCRTPDYMLSTAQDYRKGARGQQTHTWQATLDERAIVFTQHPAYLPVPEGAPVPPQWNWQREDEPGPGYWTGEASQPRSAQYRNVAVHLYGPQYAPKPFGFAEFDYRDETHAYFPHAHFDEVVQEGGWTFGRRGDAYIALYSRNPTFWREGQPEVFENAGLPFDLVAPGARNAWIVECGSASGWGSFGAFRDAVLAAPVAVDDDLSVTYGSPSVGEVRFGWEGPLLVAGEEVPLSGYPRMQNRYARVDFDSPVYRIDDGAFGLELDFANHRREAWAPPEEARRGAEELAAWWEHAFSERIRR